MFYPLSVMISSNFFIFCRIIGNFIICLFATATIREKLTIDFDVVNVFVQIPNLGNFNKFLLSVWVSVHSYGPLCRSSLPTKKRSLSKSLSIRSICILWDLEHCLEFYYFVSEHN